MKKVWISMFVVVLALSLTMAFVGCKQKDAGAPAAEVPGANGAGGNTQNAAADGNEQNAGVNHKSSLADLLHEEDEQNLTRSMKHRRKVKISEAGEGPDDLMNSF